MHSSRAAISSFSVCTQINDDDISFVQIAKTVPSLHFNTKLKTADC